MNNLAFATRRWLFPGSLRKQLRRVGGLFILATPPVVLVVQGASGNLSVVDAIGFMLVYPVVNAVILLSSVNGPPDVRSMYEGLWE
jgi:hypothetical protein